MCGYITRMPVPIRYTRASQVTGRARGSLILRDRTSADGKYLIIGNEGNEFIVTDGKGVYKTGEQIITSKVTTSVGEAAVTEIRNLTFNDESAIAPLEELQKRLPDADIFLNGELTVDFPEDVKIPIEPNQMATAALSGNRIKFSYCGLERAYAILKEQYALGTLEIKVVRPAKWISSR